MALGLLAPLVAVGVVFQACGGGDTPDSHTDAATDAPVVEKEAAVTDGPITPTPDASDGGPIDAGPLCTSTPCIVGLAVGGQHACALVSDGTVRCWGNNAFGQLGNGIPDAAFEGGISTTAVTVTSLSSVAALGANSVYGSGSGSTCARTQSNQVLCWGSNESARLGLSDAGQVDGVPHPLPGLVQDLSAATGGPSVATAASCAIAGTDLICWGSNLQYGFLGRYGGSAVSDFPPQSGAAKATAMDASVLQHAQGSSYSLVLLADGTVLAWGSEVLGRYGVVTDKAPKRVASLSGITAISAGAKHACALSDLGAVWCWGNNAYGQIGQGFIGGQLDAPVVAEMPSGLKATQVSCGSHHSCALLVDGTVACWGQDNTGQSGGAFSDASSFNYSSSAPVVVKLGGKAIAVGVGGTAFPSTGYSCAVIEGGTVQCWGYNGDGELGRGDAGSQTCVGGLPCIVTPGNVVFP